MSWHRVTTAFLVAPAVGILTAWLIAFCMWAMPVGFAFSLVPLAYALTVVFGVPALLLTRFWKLSSVMPWWYGVLGLFAACFVAVPLLFVGDRSTRDLGITVGISGVTTGLAFGLILQPKSNQRLERP